MIQDLLSDITNFIRGFQRFWFTVAYLIYWECINLKQGISDNVSCLNGKTAIITGGATGIGLMTAKYLASRGCRVIIASRRDATKERDEIIRDTQNPNIIAKRLDLCKFASIRKFAEEIKKEESKIDILINNAGIAFTEVLLTEDGLDALMQSNYVGHFLLTHLMIAVFSEVEVKDLHPRQYSSLNSVFRTHTSSKICLIIMAQEMAKKLDKYGIKVNAVDPGIVRTPIFEQLEGSTFDITMLRWIFHVLVFFFATNVQRAAQTSLHVAASKDIGTGLLYFRLAPMRKQRILNNKDRCREIWQETEKIAKLRTEEKL